jgi:hypothetical protein
VLKSSQKFGQWSRTNVFGELLISFSASFEENTVCGNKDSEAELAIEILTLLTHVHINVIGD